MLRSIILAALLAASTTITKSQDVVYPIDAAHSVISFSVGFAGGITTIDGRFDRFEGEVGYKGGNSPENLFANVTIQVQSLNTGNEQRDTDLMSASYFDGETYPEITYSSTGVRRKGNGWEMTGKFNMLGTEKEIVVPFVRNHELPVVWVFGEPRIALKGNLVLNRTEFGIPKRGWDGLIPGLGKMALSDEVEITLVIQVVGDGLMGIVREEVVANGFEAGIKKYETIAKEHEGKNTYALGSPTLSGVVRGLLRNELNEDALKMAKYNVETENTYFTQYLLGLAYKANGDNNKAIKSLEKSLELNADFARARQELDALKN